MNPLAVFSTDYVSARLLFRESAARLGWHLEEIDLGIKGASGEDLTYDIAVSNSSENSEDFSRVLVVSSGLHGVEGFFGSAVQAGLLQQWAHISVPKIKCIFLHGLNPFGFSWLRRTDKDNVDLNRNFLLTSEDYLGCPAGYAELNELLNPTTPPSNWDAFFAKAIWTISRYGMRTLHRAVASGQYEFPKGLFFGGHGPSQCQQFLLENFPRLLHGSSHVVHLDFHTGLGKSGAHELLVDYPLNEIQRSRLADWFGANSFKNTESQNLSYVPRGGLGRWCVANQFAPDYVYACAEFGTYNPISVLAGLRAENQEHHWAEATDIERPAKKKLKAIFCPSNARWRIQALEQSYSLVRKSLLGLSKLGLTP